MQKLGEELVTLRESDLEQLDLDEVLLDAVLEAKGMKARGALRRQKQYIGKLMRNEDIESIQHAIDMLDPSSEAHGRYLRRCEQWRTRLIDDGKALAAFLDEYPDTDRQQLRNLVRNAQKEMNQEPPKPGSSYKKLFQLVREACR